MNEAAVGGRRFAYAELRTVSWCRLACADRIMVGHEEYPRDSTTKSNAGRTPAPQSIPDYHANLSSLRRRVRALFQKVADQFGAEQIREYQAHLFTDRELGAIAVAQHVSALRFFFGRTLKRPWMANDLTAPKRPVRLPEVLSRNEVERLIQYTVNPLHRIWLLILYATGMRRNELIHLKVADIDSARMIHIHQGKERKDRDVVFSP